MNSRRKFMIGMAKASTMACLPLTTQAMFNDPVASEETIIDAVEIVRLTGTAKDTPGFNEQYQTKPLHVYPELHPAPYKDNPNAAGTTEKITHDYLRIKTKGGITGLYGAIDP